MAVLGLEAKRTYLVFAGSGASHAVDMNQYPTTLEFLKKLPPKIKNNILFNEVNNFSSKKSENPPVIDIEVILWRLKELADFCFQASDPEQLSNWLLQSRRLAKAAGNPNWDVANFFELTKAAHKHIQSLTDQINEEVFNFYAPEPNYDRLQETWIPLLQPLLQSKSKVEIFTTNYDLVLEAALTQLDVEAKDKVDTGWDGDINRRLVWDRWGQSSEKGFLTKLHGSVNWIRNDLDGQIFIGAPLFHGSHKRHAIIYPGFKDRTLDPLFNLFHSHLRKVLSQSHTIVFIGFAFRDENINDLCDRAVQEGTRIIVIDPLERDIPPFNKSRIERIQAGFDKESAIMAANKILG